MNYFFLTTILAIRGTFIRARLGHVVGATLLTFAATANAQLLSTPTETASQPALKGFVVQGNNLSKGTAKISLDVVAGQVVGMYTEGKTTADVARGLGAAWGYDEKDLAKLQKSLDAPQILAAARKGYHDTADEEGSTIIALAAKGEGANITWQAYTALNIWPNSTFPATNNVFGKTSAPNTIRIFSDFQCPYCKKLWDSSLKDWEKQPNEYQIIHYQFPLPFHKNAFAAAEASECASIQNKFWPYSDLLFKEYDRWISLETKVVSTNFEGYAKTAGLDTKVFNTCLSNHTTKATIGLHLQTGNLIGVNGTPTVFLNGIKLADYTDKEEIASVKKLTNSKPSASTLIDIRLKLFP